MFVKTKMLKNTHIQRIKITRLENTANKTVFDFIAVEQEIILKVGASSTFRFLSTPIDLKALVTGFLFTQGIIANATAIKKIKLTPNFITVTLQKKTKPQAVNRRKKCSAFLPVLIFKLMSALQKKQKIFPLTGGAHAALIFDARGKELAFAEDVARHNAIDKVIGKCLLNETLKDAFGIVLSSRVTLELVKKIARAKIQLIASVSAPSSLAVKAAKTSGITLCGFVRGTRMNVYTYFLCNAVAKKI